MLAGLAGGRRRHRRCWRSRRGAAWSVFANRTGLRRAATRPTRHCSTFGSRMSRAVPMDELLLQLAESLQQEHALRLPRSGRASDGRARARRRRCPTAAPTAAPARPRRSCRSSPQATCRGTPGSAGLGAGAGRGPGDAIAAGGAASPTRASCSGFIVAPSAPGRRRPSPTRTERVLTELARQVGLALHNVRSTSRCRRPSTSCSAQRSSSHASRAAIVAAADESRRQIERNLHDGAQQHLVALAVKVGLARQLDETDPDRRRPMLEELRSDVQTTLTELRELAHGIYPPLLRDRGPAGGAARRRQPGDAADRASRSGDRPRYRTPRSRRPCTSAASRRCRTPASTPGEGATITVTVDEGDDKLDVQGRRRRCRLRPAAPSTPATASSTWATALGAIGGSAHGRRPRPARARRSSAPARSPCRRQR